MIRYRRLAALASACALVMSVPVQSSAATRLDCPANPELAHLSKPLAKFSARLRHEEDIKILAIGSSSTAGTGASKTEFTYPSRLANELHLLLPKAKVKVLNHGVGGEDAQQMLPRLDRDLANEKPDLVLWQVGTNALLTETGIEAQAPLIRDGLRMIRAAGADAILIDPQYAPRVLRDPDARPMVTLLAKLGEEAGVPVFRRFALMEYWHEAREVAFSDILAPDLFHMNDWSYGCFARNLAIALAASAEPLPAAPSTTTASAVPALPVGATKLAAPAVATGGASVTPVSAAR